MQAAKDTFLKNLANNLAVVNPSRTVVLDGVSRSAVVTLENETPLPTETPLETFLLSWEDGGQAAAVGSLMYVDCKVSYGSKGSNERLRADRGRIVTAMDSELSRMCEQRCAEKYDFTKNPPVGLETMIFWTMPVMKASTDVDGLLQQTATMRLYYFSEAA